jgi:hypothetical protein
MNVNNANEVHAAEVGAGQPNIAVNVNTHRIDKSRRNLIRKRMLSQLSRTSMTCCAEDEHFRKNNATTAGAKLKISSLNGNHNGNHNDNHNDEENTLSDEEKVAMLDNNNKNKQEQGRSSSDEFNPDGSPRLDKKNKKRFSKTQVLLAVGVILLAGIVISIIVVILIQRDTVDVNNPNNNTNKNAVKSLEGLNIKTLQPIPLTPLIKPDELDFVTVQVKYAADADDAGVNGDVDADADALSEGEVDVDTDGDNSNNNSAAAGGYILEYGN